jgi:DNA-binding SARP family transcriptional activator
VSDVIELKTLGPIEIRVDGEEPPRELLWRKNLALLLYLARSPGRRRSREHLVGLLWGDKPDATARHSLNEALRVLRKAGDDGLIESVGDQVVLDASGVRIDVEELEARLAAGRPADAVELVRGSWMEGFAVPECTPFEDWLSAERMHWNATATSAMQAHGATLLARGNEAGAQETARRMLQIDPFSDAAIRLLMEAAALRGERASALGLYEEFKDRLAGELGIEPEPDTAALAERVGVERTWKLPEELPQEEIWARRVPLVGRRRELETMVSVMRRAMADRRPAVLICQGESGSGKTRLAEEAVARARLEGAAVASIRTVASDAGSEWSALYGLAAGGLLAAEGAAVAPPEALAAFLGKLGWQDPALREHSAGATPRPMPRAFTELAQAVAELRPLVLWIDNAEHADAASASALPGILRDLGGEPCTALLTLQAWPPRPEYDELRSRIGRDLAGAAVTLDPLGADDLAKLAGAVLPGLGDEERGRLARRITVDSAGLPLFAVELLNGVRLGLEIEEETAWPKPFQTMDQTYPGDLPDSVTAAIRIGFRRLSEPAREALSAAAVLEDRVEPEALVRATSLDRDRLLQALDELEWNRWMTADARGYSFVARIVRDVIGRDMLTPGQRRRIRESAGPGPSPP